MLAINMRTQKARKGIVKEKEIDDLVIVHDDGTGIITDSCSCTVRSDTRRAKALVQLQTQ